jgi:hypothetical protein
MFKDVPPSISFTCSEIDPSLRYHDLCLLAIGLKERKKPAASAKFVLVSDK